MDIKPSPPSDLAVDLTGSSDHPTTTGEPPRVGAAIKRLRTGRKMSLQELSSLSGVSAGMLSQIERDIANPSLKVLHKIRQALGAPFGSLFEEEPGIVPGPDFVRRLGHRPKLELGYVSKELLSPTLSQSLQFMILHIPPGGSSGDRLISYPAHKGGLILEGTVLLRVNEAEAELHAGDSFMFDSRDPHGFRNLSGHPCRVLWIIGAISPEQHL